MGTLYVTETGVQVHQEGQRLLVRRGTEVLQDIPMIKVDRVVLVGKSASITTPALFALTRRNVGVYYLSSQGKYILRTVGNDHRHSKLRLFQTRVSDDPNRSLAIARTIVEGKVNNQRTLVQRHSEQAPWAHSALAQMDSMRRQVDQSSTLDELRGREGLAAKEYFHLFRQILRPPRDGRSWGFEGRNYYPPTDAVNALLSFGYTLLLNDVVAACQITGLDPALGFFHAIDYNKPSMALDLEEEFRPVIVDSIVLYAANKGIFSLQDFEIGQPWKEKSEEESENPPSALSIPGQKRPGQAENSQNRNPIRPVFMKENARKRFITLYETRINEQATYPPTGERTTYRRIFELQAYLMARLILGNTDQYTPYTIR
jgi:CRISPR-associated protein Cas1